MTQELPLPLPDFTSNSDPSLSWSVALHMPDSMSLASLAPSSKTGEWSPPKRDPAPVVPERLDDFVVGKRIGEGGMAVVHEADRPGDDVRYAVKIMRPGDQLRGVAFELERVVMAYLDHPNVVPLVGHGEEDGGIRWLATPLVKGWPLRTVLDRSADMPVEVRPNLLRNVLLPPLLGICEAVHHAHTRGIIHCDLKPSNVVVTPEKHAWLLDWGMARTFTVGTPPPTAQGPLVRGKQRVGGTPGYMSPEQIRGDLDEMGPWSDIWSLGALLYELITGQRAYRRDSVAGVLRATLARPPTAPQKRTKLPADLDQAAWICTSAMDPVPSRRPASAEALAAAVAESLERG